MLPDYCLACRYYSYTYLPQIAYSLKFRVSKGQDVPLSLCPGTKKFPCPVVPLSRDKKVLPVPLSLCPGTRAGANVPGQTPLSRPVPGQNDSKFFKKKKG